ncbi:MAG TPA: DUF2383 domain-containing protein [Ohtaekwangia sp.]|uniref:DUF2383 domain-containing protein n=1 Tax=Ohtaekwangia sp. TaxID=2066019 RepID=UPI002F92EA36
MKSFRHIEFINTLIQLNYDRIACYEQAIRLLNQLDVALNATPFFAQLIHECKRNITELTLEVKKLDGFIPQQTSFSGKACLMWMEIRSMLSGKPVQAILSCCEMIDRIVMRGYDHAIASPINIPDVFRQRLLDHRIALGSSDTLLHTYKALQETYILTQNHSS